MKSRTYWIFSFSSLLVLAAILLIIKFTPLGNRIFINSPEYAGSAACIECHEAEYDAWSVSSHHHSSDSLDTRLSSALFKEGKMISGDISLRTFLDNGLPVVSIQCADSTPEVYGVPITIGHNNIRHFIADIGAGWMQDLPAALDLGSNPGDKHHWIFTVPEGNFDMESDNYWKGTANNWNSRCAPCHSTGVEKNFDPEDMSYRTLVSEIRVGCESCHGPATGHLEWAGAKDRNKYPPDQEDLMGFIFKMARGEHSWKMDPSTGNASMIGTTKPEGGIDLCARCHSVRKQLAADRQHTLQYWDDFMPQLFRSDLYYPDGGLKGEAVQYGSFLQTKMYEAGVTCLDCHDPHSGKTRAAGNNLCLECHSTKKYDSFEHHFHDPRNEGGSCISCHMPSVQGTGSSSMIDHFIRIPRPDLTLSSGSPNACNKCHTDEDSEWAVMEMFRWYGKPFFQGILNHEAFRALNEDREDAFMLLSLVVKDTTLNTFIRASALAGIPAGNSAEIRELIELGKEHRDPLMRYAAAIVAGQTNPSETYDIIFPLLNDTHRAVRFKAMQAASKTNIEELPRQVRMGHSDAMNEYVKILVAHGDLPENMVQLGDYYASAKDYEKAIMLYLKALKLDPANLVTFSKLSVLYDNLEMEKEYQELNQKILKLMDEK